MSNALRTDSGFLVDEDSGEILEWPEEWGSDRVSRLIGEYRAASEQEGAWKQAKGAYGAALNRMLTEAGEKHFYADTGTVTGIAGRRTANIDALQKAQKDELLTADEAETIILAAVQALNPDRLIQTLEWLVNEQTRRTALRELLIKTGDEFVQVRAAKKQAPKVTREAVTQ